MKERVFTLGKVTGSRPGRRENARNAAEMQDAAQSVAVQALTFLTEAPIRIDAFLQTVGLNPYNLRQSAASPDFLAGVLDYISQNEALLLAFSADSGNDPLTIMQAHACLSGGNIRDTT